MCDASALLTQVLLSKNMPPTPTGAPHMLASYYPRRDENTYKAPRRWLFLLMVRWLFLLMVYSPLWLIGASIAAMLLAPWISSLQHR